MRNESRKLKDQLSGLEGSTVRIQSRNQSFCVFEANILQDISVA